MTAVAVLAVLGGAGAVIHSQEHLNSTSMADQTATAHSPQPPDSRTTITTSEAGHGHNGISLDLHAHSTTNPSSIWVVVNKTHPIQPLAFTPQLTLVRGYQVARPAARPLEDLLASGAAAGLGFKIESAYRSYAYQAEVHAALVTREGQAAANRVSARAGYSEHQTGLAVDLVTPAHPRCDMDACFATTPAGRWLRQNAWRFGFIVRYTPGAQAITGYAPEPWHVRYIGRPLAAEMRNAGVPTLEQVFHIKGGNYG